MPGRRWLPLACVLGAMAIFSLSSTVRLLGAPVLRLEWIDPLLGPLPAAFRSSGRFFVPLALLAPVAGAALLARRVPGRAGASVLTLAVALNVAELTPAYAAARADNADAGRYGLSSPLWGSLGEYRALVLLPPYVWPRGCHPDDFAADDLHRWPIVAGANGLTINSGALARLDPVRVSEHCRAADDVLKGRAPTSPDAVYLLRRGTLATFESEARPVVACGFVDGHAVCVPRATPSRLLAEFSRPD
jgi:hypothetical protein